MVYRYYPSEESVNTAKTADEPLMIVISFDRENVIIAPMDEVVEHHILLTKCGFSSLDIDKYYRIIVDNGGADWTFVCPPDYKNITDKRRRVWRFYNDGFNAISNVLEELDYLVRINIPTRYSRHMDAIKNGN